MLSQSRSLDFSIVESNSYSKLYFTFWAWSDYRADTKPDFESPKANKYK